MKGITGALLLGHVSGVGLSILTFWQCAMSREPVSPTGSSAANLTPCRTPSQRMLDAQSRSLSQKFGHSPYNRSAANLEGATIHDIGNA